MISKKIEISDRILSVNKKWHDSIHLVHDATEGGFYGALYECLNPHSLWCNIESSKIPLYDVTKEISSLLNINPFKLLSSGAVIIVCAENEASEIVECLMENVEIPVAIVGEVTELGDHVKVDLEELKPPESDHIIQALKNLNSINTRGVQ